jgi:hypothetical protein
MLLNMQVQPLEIVYNATVLERVNSFIETPEALVLYEDMQLAAINAFTSLRSQTEAKLELAWRNHVSIAMDVFIRAPVLIIPQSDRASTGSPVLLVDLGQVSITDKSITRKDVPPRGALFGGSRSAKNASSKFGATTPVSSAAAASGPTSTRADTPVSIFGDASSSGEQVIWVGIGYVA